MDRLNKNTRTAIKLALKKNRFSVLIYVITLFIGMLLTGLQYQNYRHSEEQRIQDRFQLVFNETNAAIIDKILTYKQVLRATQGLFYASETVSRDDFRRFYDRLKLDKYYPGILGLGYVPLIPAEALAAHEAEVRASGFPDYAVTPLGERDVFTSILYLEPLSGGNIRAFGYDMYSEPVRNQAMQYARDTGLVALTTKVALVQDLAEPEQNGLLLYLPLYDDILPSDASAETRQEALTAWVYAVFRIKDLVLPVISSGNLLHGLTIYQGAELDPDKLLFKAGHAEQVEFQLQQSYPVGGQTWTFVASPDARFVAEYQQAEPEWVLWIGSLFTLMIAALLALLTSSRNKAIAKAQAMTKSLQASSQRLLMATQVAGIGVWEWDFNTDKLILDTELFALLKMQVTPKQEISLQQWLALLPEKAQHIFEQAVVDTVASGKPMSLQIKMLPQDQSSPIMVQLNAELHSYDKGKAQGLLGVCYDISDSWQHQQILQQTERRWKYALEGTGDGVWDWSIADGEVISSPRLIAMLGYEPGEFSPNLNEWLVHIHPDDQPQVKKDLAMLLDGSEPQYRNEHRKRCKDGSWKWILDRGTVIERDKQGNPLRAVGTNSDIDWRKHTELALRQSEERFRDAFDTAPIGMALVSTDGRWLEVNDSLCQMLGYHEDELLRLTFADITHPDDLSLDQKYVEKLIRREMNHYQIEKRYFCKNGDIIDVLLSVSVVHDAHGLVEHFVSQIEDITARKAEQKRVQQLAFYDSLTGLPNRRLFEERFNHGLMAAKRYGKTVALMFIDLDYFKQINDNFGHAEGDYVINTAAQRMQKLLRSTDTLARFGGDEFVVLLEEVSDAEAALKVAENLLQQMQAPIQMQGEELQITLSIGIAVSTPEQTETAESLMKKADMALYEVKADGRNGAKLYAAKN